MISKQSSLACNNNCWRKAADCASSAPVLNRFTFPRVAYKVGKSKLWETTSSPIVSLLSSEPHKWAYERVGSGKLFSDLFSNFCEVISCALACNSLLFASMRRSTSSMPTDWARIPAYRKKVIKLNIRIRFII